MILHIAPDDKFIDFAYVEFQAVSENKFYILSDETIRHFQHIKCFEMEKISTVELLSRKFISELKYYDFVVLHSLTRLHAKLVLRAPASIIFVWLGWGFDYYPLIANDQRKFLLSKSKRLWSKQKPLHLAKGFISRLFFYHTIQRRAARKIGYFSPVISMEYGMLQDVIRCSTMKQIAFSYGNLSGMLEGVAEDQELGNNILLGNSASYTNNHIEAIDAISRFDLGHRKIITPLSYGENRYKQIIKVYAKQKLKGNFLALDDFLERAAYNELISSCAIVIFNHLRQQALGNIITMMYLGAKIYLDNRNPLFSFFIGEGAFVFDMNDFQPSNPAALIPLTWQEVSLNRRILKSHWGDEVVREKTLCLVRTVVGVKL